jgi:signal transduction histidine kinase
MNLGLVGYALTIGATAAMPAVCVLRQAQDDIRQAQDDIRQAQDDIRQARDDMPPRMLTEAVA